MYFILKIVYRVLWCLWSSCGTPCGAFKNNNSHINQRLNLFCGVIREYF